MPSFDIVSEINKVEVSNAVDNANRELATRFDFRGVEASFELVAETVEMIGEGEFQLKQMMDVLRNACVKRGVDTASIDMQDIDRSGKLHKQKVVFSIKRLEGLLLEFLEIMKKTGYKKTITEAMMSNKKQIYKFLLVILFSS